MHNLLSLQEVFRKKEKDLIEIKKEMEMLKNEIETKRLNNNAFHLNSSIINGKLKKSPLTLDEVSKKIKELYDDRFSLKSFLFELTEGCMTTIYRQAEPWGGVGNEALKNYFNEPWNYIIGFYLLNLKGGFVLYPFPFEPYIARGKSGFSFGYRRNYNGEYIKSDIFPFLENTYNVLKVKDDIDELPENYQSNKDELLFETKERKLLILNQAIKTLRIRELFN